MDDRRLIIECIKHFEDIKFTENIEGEYKIGYIDCDSRRIDVQYRRDNLGKYIILVYAIEKKSNAHKVSEYLSRWLVNGRHEILEDRIVFFSVFPVLDEHFLGKQILHALAEIWDMNNIARNTPE